ncbi:MAG TPA: uracil-DNA glycosylase family protein [Gemmatimonadaceae bacterium]|nr:uracil-DNA glycosylase family protein [Gemmatimonadaceae bacterium]
MGARHGRANVTPRSLDALETHCRALADCRMCGHAAHIRPILSHAEQPRVMIVGQAPGKVEMEGGKPFAGRAGRTLFRWLERAGIGEADARRTIYIAAITRCYPGPSASGRGDRVPSPSEQDACAVWLDTELRIIRPKLLIPIGKLAITRFLPNRPLEELIGRRHVVAHAGGQCDAIPLPHPSGASSWVHQGDHPQLLDRALRLIARDLRALGVAPRPRRRSVA